MQFVNAPYIKDNIRVVHNSQSKVFLLRQNFIRDSHDMIYIIDDPVRGIVRNLRIIDYSLFGRSTQLTCKFF